MMLRRDAEAGVKVTARDQVSFRGHPLVTALHPTTIEITSDDYLTENGDCIVGVSAEKGCAQLAPEVRALISGGSATVRLRLVVGARAFEVRASGDPRLTLTHPHDIVLRKSGFISDRTIAVRADAAAIDIPRSIVEELRNPATVGRLEVEVS